MGSGCTVRLATVGYSTVEAVPVYHCCAGGSAARVVVHSGVKPPLRPCSHCGDLGEWLESMNALVAFDVDCDSIVRVARRWRASLLVIEGVSPLACSGARRLAEAAKERGLAVGARWQGGPGRPDYYGFDVVIIDYVPGGYEDAGVNVELLDYMEEAVAAGAHIEVNVFLEDAGRHGRRPGLEILLPVVERLRGSDVPLHVHIAKHGGGGPVLELYKKLREHIKFVYIHAGPYSEEDTLCPKCGATVVTREGGVLLTAALNNGACPNCGTPIPFRRPSSLRTPRLLVAETGGSTIWYHPEALPLRRRSYSSAPT